VQKCLYNARKFFVLIDINLEFSLELRGLNLLRTYLCDKSGDPDASINGIGEEATEDIPLAVDLPGVDFVAEGHHHKGVENHCEVDRRGSSKILNLFLYRINLP
jgi:hypothetical protein